MQNSQPEVHARKHYSKILFEKRLELIRLVEEQDFPISQAAQALQIKLSTAKLIVSRYRKTGNIFKRKSQLLRRPHALKQEKNNKQSVSQPVCVSNPQAPSQIATKTDRPQQNIEIRGQPMQPMYYFWPVDPYQLLWSARPYFI